MEIEAPLFNLLVNCYVIKESPTFKFDQSGKSVVLDLTATKFMENGLTVAKFLTYITLYLEKQLGERIGVDTDKMQSLKVNTSSQAKLFNWNVLAQELENLNIHLSSDEKRAIIQGDRQSIIELLERMNNVLKSDISTSILTNKSKSNMSSNDELSSAVKEKPAKNSIASDKEASAESKNKKKISKGSVDIDKIDVQKQPETCNNCVEFILLTLSQSLKLTPKQAAAFLAKENQFLTEACTKGLKNGYEPIISWYQLVYANSRHLSNLIKEESSESQNIINLVMNTFKCGLVSKSYEIVEWTLKLLSKLAFDFSSLSLQEKAWEWFISPESKSLSIIIETLSKHSNLFSFVTEVITSYSKGHLAQLFSENLKEYYKEEIKYWEMMTSFLASLLSNETFKEELQTFLIEKVEEILTNFDSYQDNQAQSIVLTFLIELWTLWEDIMTEEYIHSILKNIKVLVRTKDKAIQNCKIAEMFKLLELFTVHKNPAAPVIYKSLIFVLVENYYEDTTRQYVMTNFIQFFESSETIPVGILLEPLMKQFIESEGSTYNYNTFDFEFFISVVKHPKLKQNDAVTLMDILAKIYLNDNVFCFAASVPLMMIITRFIDSSVLMGYVKKFVTLALSMLLSINSENQEFSEPQQVSKKKKPLPLPPSRSKKLGNENTKPISMKAIDLKLKKIAIIEICKKLVGLHNSDLNELIESLCVSIICQLERSHPVAGQYDKGLLTILELFGNAHDMIEAHEKLEAERLQREEELSNRSKMLEKVEELDDEQEETKTALKRGFSRDSRHDRANQSEGMAKRSSKRIGSVNRELTDTENMVVVPYLNQKPKNRIERKAFENLEKIRQKRELISKQKNMEEEKNKLIDEKKKNKLKKQIEIRRVELGVQKKKGEENHKAIVFKEGEIEKTAGFGDFVSKNLLSAHSNDISSNKLAKLGGVGRKFIENYKGPEITLFDYDAEEQRDVDAIKIVVKKYSKLFKYLFTKYANSGYSVKAFSNFEELNKKLQTISVAEIMKMLRDHYVTNRIITKTKISEIVRQVHLNSSPLPLEYKYFVEFFIQLGYIIYTSPPNNMIHLTPAETLMKLITFFEESARSRGQSTLLYEDPDATSLGDKKIIEELNKRIAINPNYSLPEGYTKVIEKDFTYEYKIPEYYEIPESQRICALVLDFLCSKLFDFHFIEPMVKYEETMKVKPTFKKQFQAEREPFQYMNKLERK